MGDRERGVLGERGKWGDTEKETSVREERGNDTEREREEC